VASPRLNVPLDRFLMSTGRLTRILHGADALEPQVRKLVAEVVILRLFDEFQATIRGAALRLACDCAYLDGASPRLLTSPARSTATAESLFITHGRVKEAKLRWSKATFIVDSVRHTLDPTDVFCSTVQNHGGIIAEVLAVRNRIAHNNSNSRTKYREVVKRRYGASLNHVVPGTLLVTQRFAPPLADQYVGALRTVMRSCVGG